MANNRTGTPPAPTTSAPTRLPPKKKAKRTVEERMAEAAAKLDALKRKKRIKDLGAENKEIGKLLSASSALDRVAPYMSDKGADALRVKIDAALDEELAKAEAQKAAE